MTTRKSSSRLQVPAPATALDAVNRGYMEANTVAKAQDGVGGVLNTYSAESGVSAFMPNFYNDVFYNDLRGGSYTITRNGQAYSGDATMFRPGVGYTGLTSAAVGDVFVIEIVLCKAFNWAANIGHSFYAANGFANFIGNVKCEAMINGSWTTVYESTETTTKPTKVSYYGWNGNDLTRLRYTMTANGVGVTRLTSLFIVAFNSNMLSEAYLPREGGALYGPISAPADPTDITHLARKGYVDSAITNALNGRQVGWAPEFILNSGSLVSGYNDMDGGLIVDPGPAGNGILLDAIAVRIGDPAATLGGSGNLQLAIQLGTPTNAQTTLLTTINIASGSHDVVATLSSPVACAANAVLRVNVTLGSITLDKSLYVQFRGRYA